MFTRISNFTYGNYRIANIQDDALDSNIELLVQIQKYEQESLRFLLGNLTYDEFLSNLEKDTDGYYKLKNDADEKWNWLLNGKPSFDSVDCIDTVLSWSGLVKKVATIQTKDVFETLMAPYIFYYWSLNYRTLNLGVGEGKSESKSATQESSKNKRADAWNEYVQWAHFGYSSTNVSLSRFLDNHKDEFPNVPEISLQTMTYYDI